MHATAEGVTLNDICSRYTVSRRTAERLRDAVDRLYSIEYANPGEQPKRWRLRSSSVRTLANITAGDLADLDTATAVLRRENLQVQARNVEKLAGKLRAQLKPLERARIAPDLEALTVAEGLALRPGPRPKVDPEIFSILREAVVACRKMRLHYRARGTGTLSRQIVCPYGFLYGNRHYLVAFSMNAAVRDYRLYSLSDIERAEPLPYPFERATEFSLQDFVKRSFGVFQEEPFDVVWRFSPQAAAEASTFLFHPCQKFEPQKDGSLLVRFTAAGALEMAWHLYTWGRHVRVVKPKDFWARVKRSRPHVLP
ncbi:MAG: helix-turn-helix transcriptional regulator [Stellaceae bacterium]